MKEFEILFKELPPAFGRKSIDQVLPGIISSKTLANLEALGAGPKSYKLGRNVFYKRDDFLEWFFRKMRSGKLCE
jgi:hypothetical protein